jgi:hypothetical protein
MKLCDDALAIGREYLYSGGGFDVCRSVFQSTALAPPNPAATQLRDRDFLEYMVAAPIARSLGLAGLGDHGVRLCSD